MIIKTNNLDIKNSGVYRINNLATGKVYVGSSIFLLRRYRSHVSALKHGSHYNIHLQRSYDTYGVDNFEFEILENTNKEDTFVREQFYLNELYKTAEDNFYNQSSSATEIAWSEAMKSKLSKSVKRLIWEEGHITRMRKQSEEINTKRMKVKDEFVLSEIVLKYISSKSIIATSAEFNISKSALARIFKRVNGQFPELYGNLLVKIGFEGDSITDLHKAELQSKLTLYKRIN